MTPIDDLIGHEYGNGGDVSKEAAVAETVEKKEGEEASDSVILGNDEKKDKEEKREEEYVPDFIIRLKLHHELIDKNIVTRYDFDARTKNIIIELNHIYKGKRANIAVKDYQNVQKLRDGLKKFLVKEKGISEDHAKLLADVIDNNADMFDDAFYAYLSDDDKQKHRGKKEGEDNDDIGGGSNKPPPSEAEVILDILQNGDGLIQELFLDQYSTPYAAIRVNDHIETISMRTKASTQVKNWICYNLHKKTGSIPKEESLNSVLNILRARASYEGKVRKLYLRAGPGDKPDEILYDLTNKDWEFVRINSEGWSIEKSSNTTTPVFKRYKNQLPQVYPSREYPSDIFDQFMNLLNVKDANAKLLLKVYIILLIYYKIQKPILAPYGEQGSAKSTLHEYIKQVIDPSAAITLAFPRDVDQLVQKLDHNYIAYFDNISKIPEWISDQFCRAVTGSGFSKRKLYTDEDDIIFSFKRALGFNGINLAATKADLLDRCLIIMLERIKEDKRQPLENIVNIQGLNQELERIKPRLLGYIFDILSKVLKTISTDGVTKPKELPRMADFAIHGEIVARCLGYDEGLFLNAFNENIRLQTDELIESNPLAMTVFQFVQWTPEFKGTATELLGHLNFKASELGIQTDKFWPKGPGALSRRLNLIRTSLRRIGVDIEFYEHTGKGSKSRGIKVCKISSEASEASVTSDIDPNQARIDSNTSDDNDDTNKVSSEGSAKNRAQNGTSDDMYDTDDTLHTSGSPGDKEARLLDGEAFWSGSKHHCKSCSYSDDRFGMINHLRSNHHKQGRGVG